MSVTLLVFVSVALFALISGLCFVGCVLDSTGYNYPPYTTYSDNDVINNPDCVAYWPLFDVSQPTQSPPDMLKDIVALDVVGKNLKNPHNGTYKTAATHPALFPCPAVTTDPTSNSAGAMGAATLGATGIVPGDTVLPHDPNNPIMTTCFQTDGAFVSVDANSTTNPSGAFSVELWVRPEWTENDQTATRMLIDSRDVAGSSHTGFSIRVNDAGEWEAALGDGSPMTIVFTAGKADLTAETHVVLVYDGTNASLFIDGSLASPVTPVPGYVPNTTMPLIIGAGGAYLPERMQMTDIKFFPYWPFKGRIEDVAIYKAALDPGTINTHTQHGWGNKTE